MSRNSALEELYETCKLLKGNSEEATLRIIERVEELDRLLPELSTGSSTKVVHVYHNQIHDVAYVGLLISYVAAVTSPIWVGLILWLG